MIDFFYVSILIVCHNSPVYFMGGLPFFPARKFPPAFGFPRRDAPDAVHQRVREPNAAFDIGFSGIRERLKKETGTLVPRFFLIIFGCGHFGYVFDIDDRTACRTDNTLPVMVIFDKSGSKYR